MQRIETLDDMALGLEALVALDGRLAAVRRAAGDIPLRRTAPGFASLASIIVSQQVSRASADAIFGRLCRLIDPLTAQNLIAAGEEPLVEAGLSRGKQRAITGLAEQVAGEAIDLEGLCALQAEEAIALMTALPGVGPWTAQVYLLISAGHADVFPAGDVALQAAVAQALGWEVRPDASRLALEAESWRPWRSVAARLFWAYYREMRGREALTVG
ncbi:DNA-3-methyladenine glycosylase family protein [Nitratireductor thuwali]|uniref:DNA-3-methyladenine glycosylase II n=1 Tax=Nitratireductor thuwali TaxID=2267699 RepID=A0ABY5MIU0_9HYPH|nr:putative bifunctional transcriptional activator/DNA repair enzyme AlkA [Nitratireductor thuwali]